MAELFIEVEEKPSGELGGPPVIGKQEFGANAERISASLSAVAQRFSGAFETLADARAAGWNVKEVEVTFGLSLEASGNVLVAKGTAGANFAARIAWHQEPPA